MLAFTSDGRKDQTQISTALTRRLRAGFQAGITYTLMLSMHDDGTLGYTNPTANNPFDYLDGEYATSTDFQRNTRAHVGALSAAVGILDERVVFLWIRQPLQRDDLRHALRQDGQQPVEPVEHRRRRRRRSPFLKRCSIAGTVPT